MRKLVKYVVGAVCMLVMTVSIPVYASEGKENNMPVQSDKNSNTYLAGNVSTSELFLDFLKKCFSSEEYSLADSDGNLIVDERLGYIYNLYEEGEYEKIQEYLLENNYALRYSNCIENYAYERKNFSDEQYVIATDTTGHFTKEWTTILSSTFTYNGNTYEIISADSPTLSEGTVNFGAGFSPKMDNVSTSSSIAAGGDSVRFSGRYTMSATYGLSIGDLPIGVTYDFGTHTHAASATA